MTVGGAAGRPPAGLCRRSGFSDRSALSTPKTLISFKRHHPAVRAASRRCCTVGSTAELAATAAALTPLTARLAGNVAVKQLTGRVSHVRDLVMDISSQRAARCRRRQLPGAG